MLKVSAPAHRRDHQRAVDAARQECAERHVADQLAAHAARDRRVDLVLPLGIRACRARSRLPAQRIPELCELRLRRSRDRAPASAPARAAGLSRISVAAPGTYSQERNCASASTSSRRSTRPEASSTLTSDPKTRARASQRVVERLDARRDRARARPALRPIVAARSRTCRSGAREIDPDLLPEVHDDFRIRCRAEPVACASSSARSSRKL